MTIHWKVLGKYFLMVALVFRTNNFQGKNAFSEFFSKTWIYGSILVYYYTVLSNLLFSANMMSVMSEMLCGSSDSMSFEDKFGIADSIGQTDTTSALYQKELEELPGKFCMNSWSKPKYTGLIENQ
jgi:hypothetical protein